MLATSISISYGMWPGEEVDALFVKKNGFMRYHGEMYTEHYYIHSYDFLGLSWFKRSYILHSMTKTGNQHLWRSPLHVCLKTKVLLASLTFPLLLYASHYLLKQLKTGAPSVKISICKLFCNCS